VQSLSTPAIQIRTGASATIRKRDRFRAARSLLLASSITAARNNIEIDKRLEIFGLKTCFAWLFAENGHVRIAPNGQETDDRESRVVPRELNRAAAQRGMAESKEKS
jgi:hypothetical protein